MKFLKRAVNDGLQHQTLESDEESSFQRKPSEDNDSQTISSTSTPVVTTTPPVEEEKKQLDLSLLSTVTEGSSSKEPVWKRRARAYQASLPREMRSTSQTPASANLGGESNASLETTGGGPIDLDAVDASAAHQNRVGLNEDDGDLAMNTSQQTYSHELNDDSVFPSVPDNSILHTTATDETTRTEHVDREERKSSRKINSWMEKMMDPSFRKSVMASKNKAWKTVLACHRPDVKKMGFLDDESTNGKKAELPFWKRVETNLFSSSKEPQDAETSFESTSTTGSGELLTFLKRAGTSLTGFVKETTAACTQPPHDDDDEGVSFDDQSTLDSRAVSKASTNLNNEDRRLWQEFFEDENYSLGDEATAKSGSVGG